VGAAGAGDWARSGARLSAAARASAPESGGATWREA
jgi:hypothetical protein